MSEKPPNASGRKATDRDSISRRLAISGEALRRGGTLTTEEKKEILKRRARELARTREEPVQAEGMIEVLEFRLGSERYAIESSYIQEVHSIADITHLPGTPPFVTGIVNVRGRIHSVVDLRQFFDIPKKGLGDMNRLIILKSEKMEFGILVDSIAGIRMLCPGELQPPLPTLTGIREEYLMGITGDRLAVLSAGKILSDRRIVVHEEA